MRPNATTRRRACLAFLLLSGGVAQAQAPAVSVPAVSVNDAWARATPPRAAAGAAYLTLTSPNGDTLTGVSSPVAATAGVHEMRMDGTVMRMRALPGGLPLPAGQPVTLAPGGTHIMLEGLKQPLHQGDAVPLHLTFQHAPPLDVSVAVGSVGAAAPAPHAGMAMPGMSMGK